MFELHYRGTRTWSARLGPGLYRLALPEDGGLHPGLVEDVLRRRPGALGLLPEGKPGEHIVLPQLGGMISNLRLWENIILPRWYHGGRVGEEQEALALDWVRRLLPQVDDPAVWLHRTVGQVQAEDRALAGLIRVLLSPAPFIWLEADWSGSVSSVQFQLCQSVLLEHLAQQPRLGLVHAPDTQAQHAMAMWQAASEIDWITI